MPEHPLFERLMARLILIEERLERIEQDLGEHAEQDTMNGFALQRVEGVLASIDRDMRGTDGIIEDVAILAEEARRREWWSWLPAQARENIRRAS